jgi:hypothetical protein
MAIVIKSIPTLNGKDAERFIQAANKAESKPATVDFSKQAQIARKILEKAKKLGF